MHNFLPTQSIVIREEWHLLGENSETPIIKMSSVQNSPQSVPCDVSVSFIERAARWQQRRTFAWCLPLTGYGALLSACVGLCTSEPAGIKNK